MTLSKMGAGRDTLLIALGGGVTTDVVGFVASIYMRGISLPTHSDHLIRHASMLQLGKNGNRHTLWKESHWNYLPSKSCFHRS